MKRLLILLFVPLVALTTNAQDLSEGLVVNDLSAHPMQDIAKPGYLETITDPSFGTTIRRITDAGPGGSIVPMYSTIQAWNADESLMIVYNRGNGGVHQLLDGMTYQFIRNLDDFQPADLEEIFWDFDDPDILYYPDSNTNDFTKYTVSTQAKEVLVNLQEISGCDGSVSMGNAIRMMSWDSDVFTFRCENDFAYAYRISTGELTTFTMNDVSYTAPNVAPSGQLFYHRSAVYDDSGMSNLMLNEASYEHACVGKLPDGNDAHFVVAFAEGPQGGCLGNIIAHDLTTGICFPVISEGQGYAYSKSGTHISSVAHKNTEGGWIAASMIGFEKDGQALLDQELVIAKAEERSIKVCRIGHHRSDEDEFDYFGEPHAVISPTGTRVLFGSDWSGSEDGESLDCYVVELPTFNRPTSINQTIFVKDAFQIYPNPLSDHSVIAFDNPNNHEFTIRIFNLKGEELIRDQIKTNQYKISSELFSSGIYFFNLTDFEDHSIKGKFIVQ